MMFANVVNAAYGTFIEETFQQLRETKGEVAWPYMKYMEYAVNA